MTRSSKHALLVSFSGLDGSGKSTQIEHLRSILTGLGCSPRVLEFWNSVVVFARYRESFVHKVFKSERGIGAPGRPVERRDKNVRGWHVTLARHFMYLADALHLRWVVARARRTPRAIIMDRYIYDELTNLPLGNRLSRAFVRFVLAIAPRPDIAYLLDADPDSAHARKPEYPIQFMRHCRQSYLDLAPLAGLIVVPPLPLREASDHVESVLCRFISAPPTPVRAA